MIFRDVDIARGTGGRLLRPGPPGPIGTDTRRLAPGSWFLALRGERFDGERFLPHALAADCAGAIARRMPEGWTAGFVEVDDGLEALQRMAAHVRGGFRGPVVGITGSAGKTTTRALVALAIEPLGPVHQTEGNLNNHVGLPLTVVRAPVDAAAWVLELGTSGPGEIDLLQRICRPTVRLVTNVGPAHLEGLGSIEGVAAAKAELFAGARPGDVCCVYADDPRVAAMPVPDGVRVVRYGRDDSQMPLDIRLTDVAVDPERLETRFRVETPDGAVLGRLAAPGAHLAVDAAAAVAVAWALHVPLAGLGERLSRYEPVGTRLRVEELAGGIRLVDDSYNANPLSLEAALDALAAAAGGRHVALLGDMLELGDAEAEAHEGAVRRALELGFDLVGLAGPRLARAARAVGPDPRIVVAEDAEELGRRLAPLLRAGDVVLVKGSRGARMERVVHAIRAAHGARES